MTPSTAKSISNNTVALFPGRLRDVVIRYADTYADPREDFGGLDLDRTASEQRWRCTVGMTWR
jgi:hypothetical protein